MAMKKCPVCGVSVKTENLERHVKNQHPRDQVNLTELLTEEDRQAIRERKSAGKSGLTKSGRRMIVVAAIVVAAVILVAVLASSLVHPPVNVGSPAPNFTLVATTGETITLSAWRGSPVLIEFMDLDCPYCVQEAPVLSGLYANYSTLGVKFVSIDVNFENPADTPARIALFKTAYNTLWPYCLDSLSGVAALYGVSQTPYTFILNKDLTVNAKLIGVQPAGNYAAALNSALGG